MHGFYRLNVLRGFTICALLLVTATATLVIKTNFNDNDYHLTFFSSLNHIILMCVTLLLVVSEIGYPASFFREYLPLIGPESALFTLGAIQFAFASYALSDRHCVMTKNSPIYLDRLLLATAIVSGISGLSNIVVSAILWNWVPGKLRKIRRYGTPLPSDPEKGYTNSEIYNTSDSSGDLVSTIKETFKRRKSSTSSPARQFTISHPTQTSPPPDFPSSPPKVKVPENMPHYGAFGMPGG